MVRVLIADDHPVVRRGLVQILADQEDMTVIGEASSSEEAVASARKTAPDIVVLDIAMPRQGGLEALKELRRECPRLPVLILSVYPEDQYGVRTFRLGASGYLTKEAAPEGLVNAIRRVVTGGRFVSPRLAERLVAELNGKAGKAPHEALSAREDQVFRMIGRGESVTQIASQLSISVKTVSTHRSRLLQKMGLKSNAELIRYAIQNGLVP